MKRDRRIQGRLFLVELLGESRFINRYRSRLAFGPTLIEPVGFVLDRRMLLGVKERAERTR